MRKKIWKCSGRRSRNLRPHTHTNYPPCGVAWDKEYKYRHSCASHCEEKHGFYVPLEDIELLSMPLDLGELTHHGDVSKFLFGG